MTWARMWNFTLTWIFTSALSRRKRFVEFLAQITQIVIGGKNTNRNYKYCVLCNVGVVLKYYHTMCILDHSKGATFPIGWTSGGEIYFWPIKRLTADFRVSYCLVGRVEFHSWPIKRVLEVFWVSYWLAGRGAINSCPIKTLQYSWGLLNFLLAIDCRRGNLFLTN